MDQMLSLENCNRETQREAEKAETKQHLKEGERAVVSDNNSQLQLQFPSGLPIFPPSVSLLLAFLQKNSCYMSKLERIFLILKKELGLTKVSANTKHYSRHHADEITLMWILPSRCLQSMWRGCKFLQYKAQRDEALKRIPMKSCGHAGEGVLAAREGI